MAAPFEVSTSPGLSLKPSRPPIHNPYDKFTQSEFDAWIGGITGALRQALGQVDDGEQIPEPHSPGSDGSSDEGERVASQLLQDEDSTNEEEFEDSFAEIHARRAIGKGKARDPRDGPGLGTGDRSQPIEIDSASEDESDEESDDEGGSAEWDEESEEEAEQQPWDNGESSAQALMRHEKARLETDVYDYEDDVEDVEEEYEAEEHERDYEGGYENHYLPGRFAEKKESTGVVYQDAEGHGRDYDVGNRYSSGRFTETAGIVNVSDNGENEHEDEEPNVHDPIDEEPERLGQEDQGSILIPDGVNSHIAHLHPHTITQPGYTSDDAGRGLAREDYSEQTGNETEELQYTSMFEHEDHPPSQPIEYEEVEGETQEAPPINGIDDEIRFSSHGYDVEESDESHSMDTFEDEGCSSVNTVDVERVNADTEDLEAEVVQPPAKDTSFRHPHDELDASQVDLPVDIPDPWSGPRTYAEDYHSSGGVRIQPDGHYDVNHLGLYDDDSTMSEPRGRSQLEQSDTFENSQGIVTIDDEAEETHSDRTTSSPLHSHRPVDIDNPPESGEGTSNFSPMRHVSNTHDIVEPEEDVGAARSESTMPIVDATSPALESMLYPIEFVKSHMVEDGPLECHVESSAWVVELSDQRDTNELNSSVENTLRKSPDGEHLEVFTTIPAQPPNAVGDVKVQTPAQAVPEFSEAQTAHQVVFGDYNQPDKMAESVEDYVLSEKELLECRERVDAGHSSDSSHHPANTTAISAQNAVSSIDETFNIYDQYGPTLSDDRQLKKEAYIQDIQPKRELYGAMSIDVDLREETSLGPPTLSETSRAVETTDSQNILGRSVGDHISEETVEISESSGLPNLAQFVTIQEPCNIPMEDVGHGTVAEDESSELHDQPPPHQFAGIQGITDTHKGDTLREEDHLEPSDEVISAGVQDELPNHASANESALEVAREPSANQSLDVQEPTCPLVTQEYEDIGTRGESSPSPEHHSKDDILDVWVGSASYVDQQFTPESEPFELEPQPGFGLHTDSYDPWDAPPKYADGFISAGDGPFLLGGDSFTRFARDSTPADYVFLEIPKVSSGIQMDVEIGVDSSEPSEKRERNTGAERHVIGPERTNFDLDGLYDGLQTEPMDGFEDGDFGLMYEDSSAASTQVAVLSSSGATLILAADTKRDKHQLYPSQAANPVGAWLTDVNESSTIPRSSAAPDAESGVNDTMKSPAKDIMMRTPTQDNTIENLRERSSSRHREFDLSTPHLHPVYEACAFISGMENGEASVSIPPAVPSSHQVQMHHENTTASDHGSMSQPSLSRRDEPQNSSPPLPELAMSIHANQGIESKTSGTTVTRSLTSLPVINGAVTFPDSGNMVTGWKNGITFTHTSSTAQSPLPTDVPSSTPPAVMRIVMHKSTDPVLLSDPYPYNLSTPRELHVAKYDVSDEANSTSSASTIEKDLENKNVLDGLVGDEAAENPELRYISLALNGRAKPSGIGNSPKEGRREQKRAHDAGDDMDADGDVDPEFVAGPHTVPSSGSRDPEYSSVRPSINLRKTSDGTPIAPDKTRPPVPSTHVLEAGNDEKRNTHRCTDSSPLSPVPDREASVFANTLAGSRVDDELPSILIIKKPPAVKISIQDSESEELTDLDELSPIKTKSTQPLKRKHSLSTMTTPTLPSKKTEKRPKPIRKAESTAKADVKRTSSKTSSAKSKGKEKEVRRQGSRKSIDTRHVSSPSSPGNRSAKVPHFESRSNSRASSVISNAPSDPFSTLQPSPTICKPNPLRPQLQPPSLLLKHSHALPQHQHHRPVPSSFQSQRQTPSTALHDAPTTSTSSVTKHSTSNQTGSSHKAPALLYSSPVTRSNCRYHKISIPRDEDGPRIYFLVPGCALTDREVIEEEEVLDHGDATPEDTIDIEHDLESLAFDPYLVGVMRLLVGVNMWEQEVYYMRRVGEDGKALVPKLPAAQKISMASITGLESPRSSGRGPTSPKAPLSAAGSASTSASAARKAKEADTLSVTSYTESELSDDEDYIEGRRAKSSLAKASAGGMGPPASTSGRMKQPPPRGIKRNHTSIARELVPESRRPKKLRTSMSEPWTSR